jgi:hypothetical protein
MTVKQNTEKTELFLTYALFMKRWKEFAENHGCVFETASVVASSSDHFAASVAPGHRRSRASRSTSTDCS